MNNTENKYLRVTDITSKITPAFWVVEGYLAAFKEAQLTLDQVRWVSFLWRELEVSLERSRGIFPDKYQLALTEAISQVRRLAYTDDKAEELRCLIDRLRFNGNIHTYAYCYLVILEDILTEIHKTTQE